jgi:hypothetical protein
MYFSVLLNPATNGSLPLFSYCRGISSVEQAWMWPASSRQLFSPRSWVGNRSSKKINWTIAAAQRGQ